MAKRIRKKTYVNKVDRILVELWHNGEKRFSVVVDEQNVHNKCAEFRAMAVRDQYEEWEIYVVRPMIRPGIFTIDRKLSREMQAKWNESMKKFKN